MDWDEIAKFGIGTLSLCGGVAWVSKALFTNLFNKDLADHKARLDAEVETHKAQLKKSSDEYQSRVNHELQLIKDERSVVFSKLHEKRLMSIEKVYKRLYWLHTSVQVLFGYVKGENGDKEEVVEKVSMRLRNAVKHYQYNKIYFNNELSDRIDVYIQMVSMLCHWWNMAHDGTNELNVEARKAVATNTKNDFETKVCKSYEAIANDFRKLLGVNE